MRTKQLQVSATTWQHQSCIVLLLLLKNNYKFDNNSMNREAREKNYHRFVIFVIFRNFLNKFKNY